MSFAFLLLLSTVFSGFAPNAGPAPADSVVTAESAGGEGLQVSLRVHPSSLWINRIGFGFGASMTLKNLGAPGVELRATAMPSQHRGIYHAALYSGSPADARLFGMAGIGYKTTGVDGFFGIGPATRRKDHLLIQRDMVTAQARLGYHPLGTPLLLQPVLAYTHHRIRDYEEAVEGAFLRLQPDARENVLRWGGTRTSFLTYGFDAELDTRDREATPRRGMVLQFGARSTGASTEAEVGHTHLSGGAFGFLHLGPGKVLALRLHTERMRSTGSEPIPFYLLPRFDQHYAGGLARDRFAGNDLLYFSAEYRFSVLNLFNLYDVSVSTSVGAGGVYDDLAGQFSPVISFSSILPPDSPRVPLRPTFGIGLRLSNLVHDRLVLDSTFGVSTEGYQIVSIRFVPDLRGLTVR